MSLLRKEDDPTVNPDSMTFHAVKIYLIFSLALTNRLVLNYVISRFPKYKH